MFSTDIPPCLGEAHLSLTSLQISCHPLSRTIRNINRHANQKTKEMIRKTCGYPAKQAGTYSKEIRVGTEMFIQSKQNGTDVITQRKVLACAARFARHRVRYQLHDSRGEAWAFEDSVANNGKPDQALRIVALKSQRCGP